MHVPAAMAAEPICYVHIGTHKTGTTAIQRFLQTHREQLADAGLYYPRTGWLSSDLPGHHNVAFELIGDPSFDRTAGTLRDVVADIASVRPPSACLSSENFEYLDVHGDAMRALRDAILGIGYRPVVIVYVRSQEEYAESLYAELVKHGMLLSFASFLDGVIDHGVVRYRGAWSFRFDYAKLVERFASVFGAGAVIVRGYRHGESAEPLVRDFLDAMGMAPRFAARPQGGPSAFDNVRLTTGGVIARLFANTAAHVGDERFARVGAGLVARDATHAAAPFRPLTPRMRARIASRFAGDNARLLRACPGVAGTWGTGPASGADFEPARAARALFERSEALREMRLAQSELLLSGARG